MKIDGGTNSFSSAMDMRQKVSAQEVERASTEAGAKLENARTSAVEELKKTAMSSDPESRKELQEAVEKVNQYADIQKVSLRLQVEKELQRVVVKVVDKDTDEVIRQIPSEQTIALAKRLDEVMQEFLSGEPNSAFSLLSDKV